MLQHPAKPDAALVSEPVRRRCADLGMPVVGVCPDGRVEGAIEPEFKDAVVAAAMGALGGGAASPARIAPGAFALPVVIERTSEPAGCVVAVLRTGTGDDSEIPEHVRVTHSMLTWMVEDTQAGDRLHQDVAGFTTHLTHAYETIHALYSVGRAMSQVISPQHFIEGLLEEVTETLPFSWVACDIGADATHDDEVDGHLHVHGTLTDADEPLLIARDLAWESVAGSQDTGLRIVDTEASMHSTLGVQMVVQPVQISRARGAVLFAGGRLGDEAHVSSYETLMLEAAGGYLGAFLENVALYADQQAAYLGTVRAITAAIDAKDPYTRGHSERVGLLTRQLGEQLGMSHDVCDHLYLSGLVHDVGKIGIPEATLCKPGRLTDDEFAQIKRHPQIGYDILRAIPSLRPALPGVLHHHERYDGKGYPSGLAGEDIPRIGRLLALADTFDAMSSTRSYRPAMPREKVRAEILRCAGSQFDPEMVPAFLSIDFAAYDELMVAHRETDPSVSPDAA